MATKSQNGERFTKSLWRWQIACGVLLLAFLGFAGWAIYLERNYDLYVAQRISEYPLIDPARNFIPQEHFVTNVQPLRKKLRAMTADFEAYGGAISLYLEFLNTGANISINAETYIFPASLAKLPIGLVTMKKVENGVWQFGNELVVMGDDRDSRSGEEDHPLSQRAIGERLEVELLLKELLINSDNTAFRMLLRNTSEEELDLLLEATGLDELFDVEGRMSAKEYSRLFRALYTSSFLTRKNSEQVLRWLDESPFDEYLAASVPSSVIFAHKFAKNVGAGIYADSGIVYVPNRPYLISVMVQSKEITLEEERRATQFMQEVSKEAYAYFSTIE